MFYTDEDVSGGTEEASTEPTPTKGNVEKVKEKVLDVAHVVGEEVGAPDWVVVSAFIGNTLCYYSLFQWQWRALNKIIE